jgi:excinuclease ABC subunit A
MSKNSFIHIKGARTHNLKSVDVKIPINEISLIKGPSGSGKSSLAFHTLFQESKRRFIASFPNYLKFFSDRPAPVDVDEIYPVLPAFALSQHNPVINSRQCVIDLVRLNDLFQKYFYQFSQAICPLHKTYLNPREGCEYLEKTFDSSAPIYFFISKQDFINYYPKGPFPARSLSDDHKIETFNSDHQFWEVFRMKRFDSSKFGHHVKELKLKPEILFSYQSGNFNAVKNQDLLVCPDCDYSIARTTLTIDQFSCYNALGACRECEGHGAKLIYDMNKVCDFNLSIEQGGVKILNYAPFAQEYRQFIKAIRKRKISLTVPIGSLDSSFFSFLLDGDESFCGLNQLFLYLESRRYKKNVRIYIRTLQSEMSCNSCSGLRLSNEITSRAIGRGKEIKTINELLTSSYGDLYQYFLSQSKAEEICDVISVIIKLGLDKVNLFKKVRELTPSEYQRLLLIKYLSYKGTGSLFVFDEPTLGLDREEQEILFNCLRDLCALGNTLVIVDHSSYLEEKICYQVEFGPRAGSEGGEVIFMGHVGSRDSVVKKRMNSKIKENQPVLYLKNIDEISKKIIALPLHQVCLIKGHSQSAKNRIFLDLLPRVIINRDQVNLICDYDPRKINSVQLISASTNRLSGRSTVGTITDLSSALRRHFLKASSIQSLGLRDGHLSSNSELGMCPKCRGSGVIVVEMQFLEDITLSCEDCEGKKLKPIYANLFDGKLTLFEAYNRPIASVFEQISLTPKYKRILEYVKLLNLSYLSLDRAVSSLSGGERQRLYLLNQLISVEDNTLFIMENISFGLASSDLENLISFFRSLCLNGHSIFMLDYSDHLLNLVDYTFDFKDLGQ